MNNTARAEIDTAAMFCPEITVDSEMEELRKTLALELENLRCLYKSSFMSREPDADDPLFKVLYQKFRETCRRLLIDLPKQEAPMYVQKAAELFALNHSAEALEHLECALRIQPGDDPIFTDLENMTGGSEAASLIHSKKLHYQGSFGENVLSKPMALVVRDHRDILVCEPTRDAVHVFDLDFRHQGKLDMNLNRPIGIFKDEDGTAWICDYGNKRLAAVDETNGQARELILTDFAPKGFQHVRPGCACTHEGWFHVLSTTDDPHDVKIISFHRDDPAGTFKVLDSSGLFRPFSIAWRRDRLVVGTFVPSALYEYDPAKDRFKKFKVPLVPGELRGLSTAGDDLLAACTDYICQISSRGNLERVVEISKLTGRQGAFALGICHMKLNSGTEFLVADKRLGCVHRFFQGKPLTTQG